MTLNCGFAVKKHDSGKYASINEEIMPWEINAEGSGGALVLRYWGCSLSCALCYSQAYAYLNTGGSHIKKMVSLPDVVKALKNPTELRQLGKFSVLWTRIQGGEPLKNERRAFATTEFCKAALQWMLKQNDPGRPRVVIQTNGLFLGECPDDYPSKLVTSLKETLTGSEEGRVAIEVSFKGANSTTAQKYAASLPLETEVLHTQITGFNRLLRAVSTVAWDSQEYRIAIYPVAGIGPRISNPSFIPLDSENAKYPIFHSQTWSQEFAEVINKFKRILVANENVYREYLKTHGKRIPMESIEPSYFQFGWISQINKRPELRTYVQKSMRIAQRDKLGLFQPNIDEIPDADGQLIQRVADLKEDFYEAEPSNHYRYL